MRIHGPDEGDFISLERHDHSDGGHRYSVFAITGSLQGHQVTNQSVVLLDTAEFIHALSAFERTRHGSCTLLGTEDFSLFIDADGKSVAAWLEFNVCRTHALVSARTGSGRQTGRIHVLGGFTVPGELVAALVRDLTDLFSGVN